MTDAQLRKLAAYWQGRLRLQDWRVETRFVPAHELDGESGKTDWIYSQKRATVKMQRPENLPRHPIEQDVEWTLVHELLHLHFAPFFNPDDHTLQHALQEQAIDLIADALVHE